MKHRIAGQGRRRREVGDAVHLAATQSIDRVAAMDAIRSLGVDPARVTDADDASTVIGEAHRER